MSTSLVSLKKRGSNLASSYVQLNVLNSSSPCLELLPKFSEKIGEPLKPSRLEIFQINLGKMCNQACKHCHVDAGPDRKEIMTRETMQECLKVIKQENFSTIDLTGGAPEMNPNFRWFVESIREISQEIKIIDRCNLTIILANSSYNNLPNFFAKHNINVVSSLPYYDRSFTDRQRGDGVFESSIEALKMLNQVGYASTDSHLKLDIVYNPCGAFLPGAQKELEEQFKRELKDRFGIVFNSLYTITNLPISRFLEYLVDSGNLEGYMEKLVQSFNPAAVSGVMCRNTLSVGWEGTLYDCDFNQMLEIPIMSPNAHIKNFDFQGLLHREIAVDQHCYGCTAGAGSSCGGALT